MTYRLNKTNGDLLVDLVDGQIDNSTTDITLVGRNYKGFGEFINENYIKLLENFSSTSAPSNPLAGQLWWDTSDQRLKIYDGATFKAAGGPIVSNQQPQMVAGDLWIDNENNKLYFFDGTDLVLVGPEYNAAQGKTGFEVISAIDSTSVDRTLLMLYIGGTLQGIFANATFYLQPQTIPGYPADPNDTASPNRQLIQEGFNPVSASDFNFRGISDSARALVDDAGLEKTAANFIPSDANGFTTGSLKVQNSAGLSVGVGDTEYVILKVIGNTSILENQISESDMQFRVRLGNTFYPSMYVDTSELKLGIWNTTPSAELDVTGAGKFSGDLTVGGNLLVQGNATYLNVSTLTVQDKNIELGLLDDSTEGNDAAIDGAGIIVRSTDGSKDFTWEQTTGNWTSNQNIDILSGRSYRISDNLVLDSTTLGPTVTNSSLTSLGVLTDLTVDDLYIDGASIERINGTGINIVAKGDILVDSQKINGVVTPDRGTRQGDFTYSGGDSGNYITTKSYVDTALENEPIVMALDTTGLSVPSAGNPYTDVAGILESLYPAIAKAGSVAKVHCTSYAGATVSGIDVQSAMTKSYISVDKDNNLSSESVVQDVNFASASGSASLSPTRSLMTFTSNGGSWVWQNTV